MGRFGISLRAAAVLACLGLAVGCVTYGRYVPHSQFVFPNSNVEPLGPTQASMVKWSILIPPRFKLEELRDTYNEALAKYEGANILINYKEDTQIMTIPLYYWICIYRAKYKLEGEAARMEVGRQVLK